MVAANGVYKLAVIGSVSGQQHIHTLHFRSTAGAAAEALSEAAYQQQLIDGWQAAARTSYRAIFGSGDSPCLSYQARKVCGSVPLPGGVDEAEVAGSILGTRANSTQAMAPWLANVVTVRSAYAGRSYRGRFFLGGLEEADCDLATIQAGRTGATTTYVNALATAFITPDELTKKASLFVFSRRLAGVAGVNCQDAGADAISFQVRTALATMKSRKAGHGI